MLYSFDTPSPADLARRVAFDRASDADKERMIAQVQEQAALEHGASLTEDLAVETDTKKKVPFIGDVPILGLIFQKSEKSLSKSDLLVFITPHIITPENP